MLFRNKQAGKRDTVTGLDLGSRQWKGVVVQRTPQGLQLCQYVVAPCPASPGKAESQAPCAEAIQTMLTQLKRSDRSVAVAISSPAGVVAGVEMPRFAPEELRNVFSLNSSRYLRRDLSGYCFDAVELGDSAANPKARRTPTMQVFVAGAPKQEVLWYRSTLNAAKIKAETIELSGVAVINALQRSHPQICEQHTVLLLDIGHQMTRINVLARGQPLLTRLMQSGGAQISEQIGNSLGLPSAEVEQQQYALNDQVLDVVRSVLQPLAREIRASIDFIERQHDCEIRQAFAGGGAACHAVVIEALSEEVGLPIQRWNPLEGYGAAGVDAAALDALAPCLGAAVGVAVAKL